MWLNDKFWLRAARFVLLNANQYGPIFAPAEFQPLSRGTYPIAFTELFPPGRGIVVIPKQDAYQMSSSWLAVAKALRVLYADEVFIAITGDPHPKAEPLAWNHVPTFHDFVERAVAGQKPGKVWQDPILSHSDDRPYALVVAASGDNNAGDRLVVSGLVTLIREARPEWGCIVTNGDVDRAVVARAEAVFIGPGGMLFDLGAAGTRADLQNLANYFRAGFLAQEFDRPLFVAGIGHQGLVTLAGIEFVSRAVKTARLFATRDRQTAELMAGHVDVPLLTTPDLSVLKKREILESAQPTEQIVAISGDFRDDADLLDFLREVIALGIGVRFVAQATEDMVGFHKIRQEIVSLGAELLDCRETSVPEFIAAITSSTTLITTRFHSLMIALMAGIEVLFFYTPGDKRDRLRSKIGSRAWVTGIANTSGRFTKNRSDMLVRIWSGKRDASRAVQFDEASLGALRSALRNA